MVQAVVQQAVAQDWRPLPQTMRKAATFQDSVNALVFDVLMDKVRCRTDHATAMATLHMHKVIVAVPLQLCTYCQLECCCW